MRHTHVFRRVEVLRDWQGANGAPQVWAFVCECGETGYELPEGT